MTATRPRIVDVARALTALSRLRVLFISADHKKEQLL